MDLLNLQSPSGTEWELLIGVLVVLIGPIVMERFRIPGLIGLLLGGLLIGPGVLGIVPEDGGIVKSLGEVGLIYLMFTAGLELDLDVFARYRKQAITFATITFAGSAGRRPRRRPRVRDERVGGDPAGLPAGVPHADLVPDDPPAGLGGQLGRGERGRRAPCSPTRSR